MQFEKIYFDMDGVLADFTRGVRELCGFTPPHPNKVRPEDDEAMFAAMREVDHFYLKLEPIEGMIQLFNELRDSYGDKVEILSAVPRPSRGILHAEEDKREWVRRYLGDDVKVNIVLRKEKQDYALGKGYVLVDDTSQNIDEWEANGGTGVRFVSLPSLRTDLSGLGIL